MAKRPALGTPLLMDIIENRSYFDTLDDEVGQLIKKINPKAKQSVYRQAKNDLFKYVTRHRGEMFRFRKERMSLRSVNDSVLIKVGPKKRGHLAAYRGEWIRVIWHSTYGFSMDCLVHKVKVTKEVEQQLVPRGPYTKEEFTPELARAYPFPYVTVDGLVMVRSTKGNWVSSIPTDKALQNLEADEIPDGVTHHKRDITESSVYPTLVGYHKYAGLWIKTHGSREDITSGKLDWIPVGVRVYVDRSGDTPSGWSARTQEGWASEV
jgi:hypothetical protein